MATDLQRIKVLTAGILSLTLMIGIGRFAFTPLLPVMQQQAGLGVSEGGWLATVNYIGYLCGALIAASISDLGIKDRLYRIGLALAVLTTLAMGLSDNWLVWCLLRFVAGLSSAAGLLIGSGLVLHWLMRHQHRSELGIHFAGMGIGIVLSTVVVELMSGYFRWDQQWLLLSILGGVIAIGAWRWLPPPDAQPKKHLSDNEISQPPPPRRLLQLLMAAYFCAGIGYVVSITFIVAIAEGIPDLQGQGNLIFAVIGLAAIPSCMLWDRIARRIGVINALLCAFLLQTLSILAPTVSSDLGVTLLGAALYGATVIGIVSLVLTMAGRFYPNKPATMMGRMTLLYCVAQIVAPALVGHLAELSGHYNSGLYIAAGAMLVGMLLLHLANNASNAIAGGGLCGPCRPQNKAETFT